MNVSRNDIVDYFSIFSALTPDQKEEVTRRFKELHICKYEFVYHQGESAKSIYFLSDGSVKLGKMADDGREAIKEVLHAPSIFGGSVLHGMTIRQDFAQALNNDVVLFELSLDDFKYFMRINHNFCFKVVSLLSRKLSALENRMASLMIHDARGRIIDFIKKSATERGRKVGLETLVKHSLTQQEIANMTGTSRQTVTHVLNDLKKSNLIHFNRKSILVRDLAKLI